jgi:hypothetical protein
MYFFVYPCHLPYSPIFSTFLPSPSTKLELRTAKTDQIYIHMHIIMSVLTAVLLCVSRMRRLKMVFLVSSLTWVHLVAAAPGPDSAEANEADHSHSAGGCDCMEYWTCVMR